MRQKRLQINRSKNKQGLASLLLRALCEERNNRVKKPMREPNLPSFPLHPIHILHTPQPHF